MNTEDYVSLEVAKLLKEKGFREPCNAIYYVNRSGNSSLQIMFCLNEFEYLSKHNDGFQYEYLAPSLYEAQKWLRNKHQLHISVVSEGCYHRQRSYIRLRTEPSFSLG